MTKKSLCNKISFACHHYYTKKTGDSAVSILAIPIAYFATLGDRHSVFCPSSS